MMPRTIRVFAVTFLIIVTLMRVLNAQTTISGGLTGVVTDQTKAVVPNADVEIKDNAKGTLESTQTDHEGVYRFFFLAPSTYTLSVIHQGFLKEDRVIHVLLGSPVTINITLEIAQPRSEISVND
jgi:hypothetical protein